MTLVNHADTTPAQGIRFPVKLTRNQWIFAIAGIVYIALSSWILIANQYVPKFHFDPTPLIQSGIAIQIHVAGAISTLLIGLVLMFAPKGFQLHRTLGWTWVVTMAVTAISSFFITSFSPVHFSPIHALSAWTLLGLPMGITAIRRRNVAKHRKEMTQMFVGGMLIAGMFSMLPGRMMFEVFFS
ncbi:MAG: hypothetical protein CMK09_08400 [Ponticaulis sp.]|nr:hypothetical protein [Ponticaulis sp.]|tara:strand:- start:7788 stop:8339 length:552 start_codon:yes stop_codon:yes gene_type:complete